MMGRLVGLIAQRLTLGVTTLFAGSLIIFFSVELLPGDIAEVILGQNATPDTVAAFRREIGLDQPALERYASWVVNFLQGDLGRSFASRREVAALIDVRLQNTLFLALLTAVVAVPLAVTLGVLAALYRNTPYDRVTNVASVAAVSFPEFFLGYVLILLLVLRLGLFPSLAQVTPEMSLGQRIYHCALPAMTLTLVVTAHMMRMTRAAILNVIASAYVEMAHLKGLRPWRVVTRHALPNALAPIINVVVLNFAYLIAGVVIVEVVFAYPGLGQLMVDSVSTRDFPVVQATSLIFAATYVVLNLLADVLAIATNPRLRFPR